MYKYDPIDTLPLLSHPLLRSINRDKMIFKVINSLDMNHDMLTINQVAETDGGEADEGVVHAVEVRPISLDVAEQYGGQQEEYGDSGHHVNKHVEQDLLAGALLFALELFKLETFYRPFQVRGIRRLIMQILEA